MRLRENFAAQRIDGTLFLVAVGGEGFGGLVRCNATAAAIVDLLGEERSQEQIVDAMCARYDAPREEIAADVEEVLNSLRRIGALEE
ncbi:MAG: PqqD family protein [Oscillospiraceae bacterium]|nr:PqqD family protein [Oscillospiraceae bacterium]